MRRRANSNGKPSPGSEHRINTIEMTTTTNKTKNVLSISPVLTRKRPTHTEMERGSFSSTSSAAAAIATAAETVATSMDCDMVCASGNCSQPLGKREDEEIESSTMNPQENESLLHPRQGQEENHPRIHHGALQEHRQPLVEREGSSSSFPHIDVNIDAHMNIDVSVNMENFDFDFHALPVEIQMALEDTLLGWTHLTSITLGHVLLPWLVFHTVKRTSKYVLETTVYTMVLGQASVPASASLVEVTTTTSSLEEDIEMNAIEAVLVSPTTHVIMGIVAAIAAFRVIRNRRRVWFRHAYGSKEYRQFEEGRRRHQMVLEADQRRGSLLSMTSNNASADNASSSVPSTQTWTSQVLTNYKRKRHRKKLQRASDRFERHHTGLSPKQDDSIASISSRANARRQRFLRGENNSDSVTATSVATTVDDCYDSSSSEDWDEGVIGASNSKKEMSSRSTKYTFRISDSNGNGMSSIAHDAVCIPRIHNRPYAHGGFFGAAPFFLADRFWVGILRELLPDVYVEISRRVGGGSGFYFNSNFLRIGNGSGNYNNIYRSDASKLIHWAENNPVVAAYGVVMDLKIKEEMAAKSKATNINSTFTESNKSGSSGNVIDQFYQSTQMEKNINGDHQNDVSTTNNNPQNIYNNNCNEATVIPNLEWDIFVDPQLVRRVEAVLDSMDRYISSKKHSDCNSGLNTTIEQNDSVAGQAKHHRSNLLSSHQDNCEFCEDKYSNSVNKNDNDIALFDEDDNGESEAAALLADHDHDNNTCNNIMSMNMGVDINNLCGNSADEINSVPGIPSHEASNTSSADTYRKIDCNVGQCSLENDPVLRYLERELERRTQVLTDRLLIAHGNVLQLITEQAGFLKDWNYSRVQRTRRTLGGGMYARQWMAVFAESLRLGMNPSSRKCDNTQGQRSCNTTRGQKNHDRADYIDSIDINNEDEEEIHNFYDEDEHDEIDALLPQQRDQQNDPLDGNPDEVVEDDHNHCTRSPICCLDTTMEESLKLIEKITQTKQPIGILLDLKSRHVPKRVLTLMVRSLQKTGIRVVGIASFNISDIRGVCCNHNSSNNARIDYYNGSGNPTVPAEHNNIISHPLSTEPTDSSNSSFKEILMVHSAGDLQAACDEGLVRPGDHVFFNGGSLIVDSGRSSTLKALFGFFFDTCACGYYSTFDPCVIEEGYRIQSYGYACSSMDAVETAGCFANDGHDLVGGNNNNVPIKRKNVHGLQQKASYEFDHLEDDDSDDTYDGTLLVSSSSEDTEMGAVMKTLADYKKYYGFSMGLYLQEFSIDEAAAKLLIDLVNQNPELYNLGLAWGGINGMTVHGIQPGRFTSTDGYWMQRRLGLNWKDPF